jgi:hypothetical protein
MEPHRGWRGGQRAERDEQTVEPPSLGDRVGRIGRETVDALVRAAETVRRRVLAAASVAVWRRVRNADAGQRIRKVTPDGD